LLGCGLATYCHPHAGTSSYVDGVTLSPRSGLGAAQAKHGILFGLLFRAEEWSVLSTEQNRLPQDGFAHHKKIATRSQIARVFKNRFLWQHERNIVVVRTSDDTTVEEIYFNKNVFRDWLHNLLDQLAR
ncbi:hypothetical protein GOP47_0022438, partial [Adiantum capillus-veneris]